MKITIVQGAFFPVPPLLGGAVEKAWYDLGREFARQGHSVTHLSRRFSGLPTEEIIEGVRHVRVSGFDAPRSLLLLKFYDLLYSIRVIRHLPVADILVTNTFWLPLLVRSRKYGRLYIHVARYPKGQLRYYRHADRLQTVSQPIAREIVRQAPAVEKQITVIPYPVGLPEQGTAESCSDGDTPLNILYAGRIHPEKGIHLLLKALAMLELSLSQNLVVRFVGPWQVSQGGGGESYWRELHDTAEAASCSVEWVGPVFEREKLNGYYRQADLFIYPSLAEKGETFGLAPLEAMAHCCPPLVSGLECFQDFVADDENGFIFDHRSPQPERALASRLASALKNRQHLIECGKKARIKAEEFSLPKIAALYLNDFAMLLSK